VSAWWLVVPPFWFLCYQLGRAAFMRHEASRSAGLEGLGAYRRRIQRER
jgi:hypothetical protein